MTHETPTNSLNTRKGLILCFRFYHDLRQKERKIAQLTENGEKMKKHSILGQNELFSA